MRLTKLGMTMCHMHIRKMRILGESWNGFWGPLDDVHLLLLPAAHQQGHSLRRHFQQGLQSHLQQGKRRRSHFVNFKGGVKPT